MPQRNVATNFTFEQQRQEINLLAADFTTFESTVNTAAPTYLKHDGSNDFTGQTLAVPNAFTINSNSGSGTVTISGNLNVTGTTTTVNTTNLEITDKNILISKGSTSDAQADGAGITIDSATDITFNFVDANDALVSSIGLEGTTFLKAPRGQFTGNTSPTTGSGVEINAPDANTGQIISYDRGTTAYKELRLKGSSVGIYGGTTNALVGSFSSTGLSVTGTISSSDDVIITGANKTFKAESSSSGDYVRMYAGSGTGQWDIYGNGDNLRFSDNASAGSVIFDRNVDANSGLDVIGTLNIDGNSSNTTQFSGYNALRIHNANGSALGITADMYFTVGTGTTNRGAAIGVEYSNPGPGNALYFATNPNAVTSNDTLEERMRITPDGMVLIGTSTKNTSDRFTIVDPGNAFMSLRSDQHADLVSQHLDFIVGTGNRSSGNMVSAIRAQVPDNTTAGGTLKGELSFWTNSGDNISENLTIHSDGSLRTTIGSEISHKSGGDKLVYADLQEYGISDNDNGYKTMKTWRADKGGSFTLDVSMMIQSGTYYYSYIVYNVTQGIRVNQTGNGNDSNNLTFTDGLASGQSNNVHAFRRFSIACGNTLGSVRAGDQLELRMASTQIDGTMVTGNGQRLLARGLKIFSTTGNPGTGAVDGAGYNAAMNTRNCCYWWLDRNGNYNGFESNNESTSISFNRLVESANLSDDDWNNGVVTIHQDGVYALNASAYSIGNAFTQGWWIVDGARHNGCDIVLPSTSAIMSMSGFMYLTAGQTVGFHPHYSGSSSITINDNTYHTYFRGCLINATNATRNSYA